ncbi:unnamed protein product [Moneuplotes crassus]|uniref:Ion transport domain-containing protein n=1 Tax=Euplotes crassus TaxID=5936 RepID=A0AAD1X8E5_EUPCR|nr:unnamed protein product [Moneuplotes crassus]
MKSDNDDNINMIKSDMWMDIDTHKSAERQFFPSDSPLYYQDPDLENSSRFEEEEEKEDSFFPSFIQALKNVESSERINNLLQEFKIEIKPEYRYVLIHLVILFKKKELYNPINEYFDEISGQFNLESSFVEQELPESYDELLNTDTEISNIREKSVKLCIRDRIKPALLTIFSMDSEDLTLRSEDLFSLYEIGKAFLFKALNERVKVDRTNKSVPNMILDKFREEHDIKNRSRLDSCSLISYVDAMYVLLEKNKNNFECRKILSKISDHDVLTEIIGLLIIKDKYTLVNELEFEFDRRFVQIALENDCYDVVFHLRNKYPQSFTRSEATFLEYILQSFTKSNHCWLAKCFMLKSVIHYLSYRRAEDFLYTIAGKIDRTDPKDNPLYFTPNLLLLIINIYEVCILITREYPFLSAQTDGIIENLTRIGSNFIREISDEERLRALVFERDFENRDSLELLSRYNITDILNNKNMEKIALELWSSEYDVKGNLMECSSALSILSWNTFNKPRDLVEEYMFYNFSCRKKYAHHLFQYQIWKKSMMAKFITEAVFLFFLTVTFQYFLIQALRSGHELLTVYTEAVAANSSQEAIDVALEEHHGDAITFYNDMEILQYLSIIAYFYPMRIVLEAIYATLTKRSLRFLSFANLCDIVFSLVFFIKMCREFDDYRDGLSDISDSGKKAVRYFENIYEYANDEILLDVLYAIAMTALWLRILYMFRLTRFLGPLLKMVFSMLWDITIFMVLFGILLVVYASLAVLLFYTEAGYTNFYDAMITLFGSALGNFDFNSLDGSNKGRVTGEIYLVSFIILCNILILNLLIAILSTTYAQLDEKKVVLYINEILKLRSSLEYEKRTSGLISAFPPWNFFPLILSPFYFIIKDTRKFNEVVCHICYFPVLFLATIIFIVINCVILPLTYFKGVLVKLQFIFNKKVEVPIFRRINTFFIFFIGGPIILVLNLCVDIYMFFLHCYDKNINYRKEKSKVQFISSKTYHQLQTKFEKDVENGVEAVPFTEAAEYCRNLLKVMDLLRNVIFSTCENNISYKRQILDLQEYGKVKNVLYAASIKHGSQRYIFCMIWRFILKELKVNSRVRQILGQTSHSEITKSAVMMGDKQYFKDSSKDFLRQFLQISLCEAHEAIKQINQEEITLETIKETFELVLFEKSQEGQKAKERLNHKTPYSRKSTLMNKTGSKWSEPTNK